jgi:ubiquinone/menaquinone biosynthesis C-methylase UbiE
MSDHFRRIYSHNADQCDEFVSREDYQGNVLSAIEGIAGLSGSKVVEIGAGSGRLTRLIAPHVAHVSAFDVYLPMLAVARDRLADLGIYNVTFDQADNKHLPASDGEADIVIAGWTLGHCCDWFPDTWRTEIASALSEMLRVLSPGGTAIILETLGTGSEDPHPPNEALAGYYNWLESDKDLSSAFIRTDYKFRSVQEGRDMFSFLFGEEFLQHVEVSDAIVPECTGVWWYQKRA